MKPKFKNNQKLRSVSESVDHGRQCRAGPPGYNDIVDAGCCPVPMVACCCKGEKLPTSEPEGVRMFCSNKECPVVEKLLHRTCFEELENGLLKILQAKGSARRWTEEQRLNNLWTKKGMTLLGRYLRCRCSKGLLDKRQDFRMPERAVIAEVPTRTDASEAAPARKKRVKDLPSLNTQTHSQMQQRNLPSSKRNRHALHFLEDHSDDEIKPAAHATSPPTEEKSRGPSGWAQAAGEPVLSASTTDWPALDPQKAAAQSPAGSPVNDRVAKPKKTFSEITQQSTPKPAQPKKKEPEGYKVLSKKELPLGRRILSDSRPDEHQVPSSTSPSPVPQPLSKLPAPPGWNRDSGPARHSPALSDSSSGASDSLSEADPASLHERERVPGSVSVTETLSSLQLKESYCSKWLDFDTFDFGPAYKTNEAFIQALLRDAAEHISPPSFLADMGLSKPPGSGQWPKLDAKQQRSSKIS